MSIYNLKSTENRQKTPELHAEDREAISERWPVRHNAYTEVYVTLQKTFPEAFRQPAQTYDNHLGAVNPQPSANIGGYAVKNYDNQPAEVSHLQPSQSGYTDMDIEALKRQAAELAAAAEMGNA